MRLRAFLYSLARAEIDPSSTRVLGQLGAICLIAGGLLMGATMPFVRPDGPLALSLVAVVFVVSGLIAVQLPWERWPRPALMSVTVLSITLMAVAARLSPGALQHYLSMYVVAMLFIGMTQRPRVVALMAVVVVGSYLAGTIGVEDPPLLLDFSIAFVAGVLSAFVLGRLVDRFRESNDQIDNLLTATRELGRSRTAADTISLLEAATCQLAGADSCLTFLAADPRSRRFVSAAAERSVVVEASVISRADQERLFAGENVLVPDVRRADESIASLVGRLPVRALLLVPVVGLNERLGAVVVCWNHPVFVVDAWTTRAIEIVSKEAAVVLERQREAEQVRHEAETDPLTDLLNRRSFDRALVTMDAGDCLIVVDLDDFKDVNDREGHLAGDETLRSLAQCMVATVRVTDTCARFGGDEFMVIVRGAGERGGQAVARNLQARWAETAPLTTISMGVAVKEADELGADTLARADEALYQAKAGGRARFELAASRSGA